jgi:hypothetical protein
MLKFVSLMVAAASLMTGAKPEERGCSVATLNGAYGFMVTGTRPSGPPPAALEQMVGVVLRHFDGLGQLTGTENIHGSLSELVPDRVVTGTYSVNQDCSGTINLTAPGIPPLEMRFVVTNKGKEIIAAVMSPANVMVTAIGRKL